MIQLSQSACDPVMDQVQTDKLKSILFFGYFGPEEYVEPQDFAIEDFCE